MRRLPSESHLIDPSLDHRPSLSCARHLILLLLLGAAVQPSLAQLGFTPMDAERLSSMSQLADPILSPDGRQLIFVASRRDGGPERNIDLWITEPDDPDSLRQLTRDEGLDVHPAWSPDSQRIVYTSYQAGLPGQLHQINLRGGAPERLADFPTDMLNARYTPDGQAIVFEAMTFADIGQNLDQLTVRIQNSKRSQQLLVSDSLLSRRSVVDAPPGAVRHLFRLMLSDRSIVDLTPQLQQPYAADHFDWDLSPDGRWLAIATNTSPSPYLTLDNDILLMDVQKGSVMNLTAERSGSQFTPRFGHTQDSLLYAERKTPQRRSQPIELIRHQLRSSRVTVLTDDSLSAEEWAFSHDDQTIYFTAQSQGRRHLYRTTPAGARARLVTEGGAIRDLSVGPRGQLLFIRSSLTQPPEIYLTQADGRRMKPITRFNESLVRNTRLGTVTEQHFAGSGGDRLQAWVLRPPGFDASRRWPVIIMLHGGPYDAWLDEFSTHLNPLIPSAAGYIVVALNGHGSTGFGQSFAASIDGDPVSLGLQDLRLVISDLARRPDVDADRIGVLGYSYGGYLGYWAARQPLPIRCLIVHAGVIDVLSHYATDYPWGRQYSWGALPQEDPSRINQLSPAQRTGDWPVPTLILHGQDDQRVLPAQSLLAHHLIQQSGGESRLALIPNEAHSLSTAQSISQWWEAVFDWLDLKMPPGPILTPG